MISVASEGVKEKALAAGEIAESEVVRFIEVKGRSSRTGEVELTDNEYEAAERLKERYFLYRVFVDPSDPSVYEVAVLQDGVPGPFSDTGDGIGRALGFTGDGVGVPSAGAGDGVGGPLAWCRCQTGDKMALRSGLHR